MKTNIDITATNAKNNAWKFWEKNYGPRLEAILLRIRDDSDKGIVSIEEVVPLGSVTFLTNELKHRLFVVEESPIFDGEFTHVMTDDVRLTINW
jgi:hypothetical protein